MESPEFLKYIVCNYQLFAVAAAKIERSFLLKPIIPWANLKQRQLYYWNPGHDYLQEVRENQSSLAFLPIGEAVTSATILEVVAKSKESSIFILEGLLDNLAENRDRQFQILNFYQIIQNQPRKTVILTDEYPDIPIELLPILPLLKFSDPERQEISSLLTNLVDSLSEEDISVLIDACYGLARQEIVNLISHGFSRKPQLLKPEIVTYKQSKLANRGITLLPEPDVPDVAGLDLLERDLQKIKVLYSLEATERGLHPPKGALLWGLPGTGKSLVAKLAAQKIGAILVPCDWNKLLANTVQKSLSNLEYVLNIVDNLGPAILYFDEFEKAFTGLHSGNDGGVLAKMAGKLLSWLQDHESPVMMMATINHLDLLPPELVRRFEYIWFFDSQLHNGAMWQIFQLHLERFFPGLCQRFSDMQWRKLFIEYRSCSPAEIGGAVKRTADELFFQGRTSELDAYQLWNGLLTERQNFLPALANATLSDQLAKIRLEADFARPVRGQDTSRFAVQSREIFEPPAHQKASLAIDL